MTDGLGNTIRDYIWMGDMPVAMVDYSEGIERITYLHADHLNTPRYGTNLAGAVVWQWQSDAFGNGLPAEDVDGDGVSVQVNLRFPGQYYDAESGLHYNWNRYYDPSIGRYITSDPIGLAGGLNTYAYVGGNPLNAVDPLGLSAIIIGIDRGSATPNSTPGQIAINGSQIGHTLELPWKGNKKDVSRIPAGTYFGKLRESPSRGYEVIELIDVPGRTNVQLHIGNFPEDTLGCILPGKSAGNDAVYNSKDAFNEIMGTVKGIMNIDAHFGEGIDLIINIRD